MALLWYLSGRRKSTIFLICHWTLCVWVNKLHLNMLQRPHRTTEHSALCVKENDCTPAGGSSLYSNWIEAIKTLAFMQSFMQIFPNMDWVGFTFSILKGYFVKIFVDWKAKMRKYSACASWTAWMLSSICFSSHWFSQRCIQNAPW